MQLGRARCCGSIDGENENKLICVFNKGERIEFLSMKWLLLPALCIVWDSKGDGMCGLIKYTHIVGLRAWEDQHMSREEGSWKTVSEGTDECETDVADADILSPFLYSWVDTPVWVSRNGFSFSHLFIFCGCWFPGAPKQIVSPRIWAAAGQ